MENRLKDICSWVSEMAQLEKTINQNKFSLCEVKALMQLVDIKRKGFLDLNDVYQLAGKITENQLFTIFKFLDTSRTGEIRLEQLQQTLGNPSLNSQNTKKQYIFPRFYAIIDTVKDKTKTASDLKRKYRFNPKDIKVNYSYILNLIGTKYLTTQDLITVLKTQAIKCGMRWEDEHDTVIRYFLPDQNITENKFVQCFSDEPIKLKEEQDDQCLLTDIDNPSFYSSNQQQTVSKVNPITLGKSSVYQKESNPSIIYKKTNNFIDPNAINTPSFRPDCALTTKFTSQALQNDKSPKGYESSSSYQKYIEISKKYMNKIDPNNLKQHLDQRNQFQMLQREKENTYNGNKSSNQTGSGYKRQFDQIQGSINEVLNSIQARREKLRQDSCQRKKLIQGVMNRKRQICGVSNWNQTSSPKQVDFRWEMPSASYQNTQNIGNEGLKNYQEQSSYQKQFANSPNKFFEQNGLRREEFNRREYQQIYGSQLSSPSYFQNTSYLNRRRSSVEPKIENYLQYISPGYVERSSSKYGDKSAAPLTVHANLQIGQILRKYNNYGAQKNLNRELEDINTLKQLCKSKSGLIYTPTGSSYNRLSRDNSIQNLNSTDYKYMRQINTKNSKINTSCKENVMKRAEEEANRKIEEIQRKARMKVLQKKGALAKTGKKQDFSKLIKKGCCYY